MKSKRLLLLLLMALMAPWAAMAQQALPYSYGFEDNDLSADGWTTQNPSGLDASEFGISDAAKKTGDYGFRFSSYDDHGDHTQYLISPELNATTGVVAQFYYRASYGSGTEKFKVGYSTTNTDIASFNFGSEISTSSTSWTQSAEFAFPAGTKYVAIYYYSDYQYRLFVDDLTFEAPASCPKPTGLVVSNITHNEAKLSWTENGTATSWQVCLNNDETTLIPANSNPYTLTGLTPSTAYTAKVRAIGNDEYSAWSNEVSFSTTAEAEVVGDSWNDDFEGTACGWELVNGNLTNQWVWGTAVNNGGTHALYVSNDGGATNNYSGNNTKIFATKLLNFAEGKYDFSYDWLCKGESTWDFLRVALVPASETLTAGTDYSTITQPSLPTGWIALDGGKLNLQETWQSKDVAINVAAGNYYLVLAWRNETGAYSPAAAVDNVSITRVACGYDVTGLAAGNITTTSADITWTAGEATEWQVAYKTNAASEWTANEPVSMNSTTLSGLAASTNYQVKVRAYCGGEDYGSWCDPITFVTACDVITDFPWSENFDGYTVASAYTAPSERVLPSCWNAINTTTYSTYSVFPTIYYYSSTNYANSTLNSLKFYSYYSSYSSYDPQSQYAILPEMSNLAGKEVVLYARGYNTSSTFKIGTMSDPDDASTFNLINEQTGLTTSYQKFSYIIPADRTDSYLAIMIDAATSSRTTNGVFIDNITVKEMVTVDADEIVAANPGEGQMTWSQFAQHVNNGDHFTSNTITLMEDITITEMVGTAENPFTGTFDGSGFTITADITSSEGAAPFQYIKNATIQNLKVTGSVTSTARHSSGLVARTADNSTNVIHNCRVSTNVEAAELIGGIIAHGCTNANNTIEGCVYDGYLNITNASSEYPYAGGLQGWSNTSTLTIRNSVFDGTVSTNAKFHPVGCKTGTYNNSTVTLNLTLSNCYYTVDPTANFPASNNATNGTSQSGKRAYTITGAGDITVEMSGTPTEYDMSGIKAYASNYGLLYNDGIIAGDGDQVVLTLSGAAGYEADHGTLVANGDVFTLTMEAYDTKISGVDCPVPYNVEVSNVEARSAQVTWMGGSDSYTVEYGEVVDVPTTYDFEDQTIPTIFTNSETHAWTVTSDDKHEGTFSIKSGGAGTAYATSDLTLTLTLTDNAPISFWYKASSEANYDYGRFLIDGSQKFQTSGTSNEWTQYTGELTAGTHTLIWRYYKDSGTDSGDDCFYVDDITITSSAVETWTTLSNIPASPYTIENLNPETTYQVKVSGTCASVETEYSDVVEFTTLATCPAPTELAVTDGSVTAHAATITWTENGEATTWIVEYADNADFTGVLTETVEDNATYSFDNLDGETTYYVRVKAHCGDEDESYYSNVVNFTTLVACQAPTVLTVTEGSVTTNQVELSWTENGTATAWQICLNGDETNLIAANSNPFTLESLTAATSYTVKVRANCGDIDGESAWSNDVSFTTDCDAITLPYTYGFEDADQLACWTMTNCLSNTGINSLANHTGSYGFLFYYVENSEQYLISPEFESTTAQVAVSFYYMNYWSDYDETFLVGYSTTTNDVAAFTWGDVITADENDWVLYSDVFPAGTKYVALKHTSDDAFYLFVDDFSFQPVFTKTIAAVGEEGWANGKGGYYFIASPVDEFVTPAAANGFITDNYDLYYFSQTGDSEGNEWINFKDETLGGFDIVNGKGYLYASKEGTTLTFTGTPGTNGMVPLDTYNADARFNGWNLIGNPFAQDAYITKPFYTLENSDTYTSNDAGTAIQAMQGLLVVADSDEETVTFTTTAPVAKNSKLNMNLRRDNKQLDNAILVFGGEQKLGKMTFRANSSKIYMPVEGKDYAITSVEGQVGEVPVSFVPESNGTYSLSFTSEEVSFSYLHLIDNMTGADVDLLQTPSYTFDARTTDYESRFRLVFATGSSTGSDTFGFVNASGNFCIFGIEGEATVQVIDVLGHVLSSETFSGSYEKRINGAPGVYMVRLIQGNDVKVQKVVVRR